MFLAKPDEETIQTIKFDPCYPCFKDSIKKILFQIFIKQESKTEQFVPYCPFNNLIKFLTNPPIFFLFQMFSSNLS